MAIWEGVALLEGSGDLTSDAVLIAVGVVSLSGIGDLSATGTIPSAFATVVHAYVEEEGSEQRIAAAHLYVEEEGGEQRISAVHLYVEENHPHPNPIYPQEYIEGPMVQIVSIGA